MRKVLILLLIAIFNFSLIGCLGGSSDDDGYVKRRGRGRYHRRRRHRRGRGRGPRYGKPGLGAPDDEDDERPEKPGMDG